MLPVIHPLRLRRPSRFLPRATGCASLLVLALTLACTDRDPRPEPTRARPPLVLIGIDGLEWSVLGPLVEAGRVPHLQRLIAGGVAGRLSTIKPTLSPAIWTSIATGKRPEEHGIVHFLARDQQPFTSADRRVRALWNIASQHGRDVLCVGWWMTWPAEPIRGAMVAPYASAGQDQLRWKGNLHAKQDLPDQTWPRALIDELEPLLRVQGEQTAGDAAFARVFGAAARALAGVEAMLVEQTRWSLDADETFLRAALHVLEQRRLAGQAPPDLTMVYFGAPDVASHRFWAFRHPERFAYRIPLASVAALSGVIDAFYEDADRKVGALLAQLPEACHVIVCSDHGFEEYATERPSELGLSGHHVDGPPGVFVAHGPAIRPARTRSADAASVPDVGRVYEVAPLVLRLLGIPSARDFAVPDGGALLQHVLARADADAPAPTAYVDTHDAGFEAAHRPQAETADAAAAMRAWMAQLGYLDGVGEDRVFVEVLPRR